MFCQQCGVENASQAKYCQFCGATVVQTTLIDNHSMAKEEMKVKHVGFWIRAVAVLIDSIVLSPITFLAFLLNKAASKVGETSASILMASFSIAIATWLYHSLMLSSKMKATFGKRAVGIVVTDLNGERISFGRATARYFSGFISAFILGIGYFMAGFTEKKQALHDMITGTLVIKK